MSNFYLEPGSPDAIEFARANARRAAQGRPPTGTGSGGGFGGSGSGGGGTPTPATPTPSGVATGLAFNGDPAINLFSSANFTSIRQPAAQNYMTQYYIPEYRALRCDLYFNDFSGGIDAQIRQLQEGVISNELAQSFFDAKFSRTLNLPPLVTTDATAGNEIGTIEAMSACFLNDGGTPRWLVAAGDTANKALFALDDNAGAPRITPQTYTPSSNIVSLTTVKIVTNTQRVMVGRAGGVAQILTNFAGSPTTSGSMHANTTQMWGAILSPLNSVTQGAQTILMYCNDGLYSLSTATSAIGDAPTAVLTNWPGGGYALGRATLPTEGVARAYWVHPLNDLSASALDTMEPCKIVSTNLEGTDPKDEDVGLPFVRHAMMWRGAPVATDGKQIHWMGGSDGAIDLGWNRERRWESPTGDFGFGSVMCLATVQDRLFAAVATITLDANDVNKPSVWEEYIPEENSWHFVTYVESSDGLLPNVAAFTGQTPVYQPHGSAVDNGIFFWYSKIGGGLLAATYNWRAIPLLSSGVNPNWQQAESAYIRHKYATSGSGLTPIFTVMGLPLFVSDIWCGGTFPGEDSSVTISIQSPAYPRIAFSATWNPAVFAEDTDWRHQWWENTDIAQTGSSLGTSFQLKIAIAQGTSGTYVSKSSPNPLPFRVGFYVYMDGEFTPPRVMEPDRYFGPKQL